MNITISRLSTGHLHIFISVPEQILLLEYMTRNGMTWSNDHMGWIGNDNNTIQLGELYRTVEAIYYGRRISNEAIHTQSVTVAEPILQPVFSAVQRIEEDNESCSEYIPSDTDSTVSDDETVEMNTIPTTQDTSINRPQKVYYYYKKGILIPSKPTDIPEEREVLEPEINGFYNKSLKGFICHLHDEEIIKGCGYVLNGTITKEEIDRC